MAQTRRGISELQLNKDLQWIGFACIRVRMRSIDRDGSSIHLERFELCSGNTATVSEKHEQNRLTHHIHAFLSAFPVLQVRGELAIRPAPMAKSHRWGRPCAPSAGLALVPAQKHRLYQSSRNKILTCLRFPSKQDRTAPSLGPCCV